jgi:hypothetical protein
VKDYLTDGFGIFKTHLDTTNEYSIIISSEGYITQNILLNPVLQTYKISMLKQTINSSTIYDGITETLTPQNSFILNSSNLVRFNYAVLDSKNLIQSLSLELTSDKNINCIPSCYTELNNSYAGGSIYIDVLLNETQNLILTTKYKRINNDAIIKTYPYSVINSYPTNITGKTGFDNFKALYKNSIISVIIVAFIQTIAVLLISQLGVFGLAILPILIFLTICLGIFGLLSPILTIITCIWGIFIYFLSRGQ